VIIVHLTTTGKRILRQWLMGRERVKTIDRARWNYMLHERTSYLTSQELGDIVDLYGHGLIDVLRDEID